MCYQAVAAAMIGLPGSESSDPMTAEVRLGMLVVQIHTFAPFFFSSFYFSSSFSLSPYVLIFAPRGCMHLFAGNAKII